MEQKKTRVTVLMPVYNGELYLREAMDSVLAQTYSDFCYMIIDDGSVDTTAQLVKSYSDERIFYLKNDVNIGLVATLNRGLALIDSEYIARMDADDIWHHDKLQKQIDLLDSRPDVGICGTCINKFGDVNGVYMFPEESDSLKVGLLFYCMMSHPSVVYRNSFLKESHQLYRSEYFPAEDYKMWIEALQYTKIYNIQEVLVEYRQHQQQICREKQQIQHEKENKVKAEQLKLIYPDCSEEEMQFHLSVFATLKINNLAELKKCRTWIEKIIEADKKLGYVETSILKKELWKYLHAATKEYFAKEYLFDSNLKGLLQYFVSFNWRYLDFHRNLSLIKNVFKS